MNPIYKHNCKNCIFLGTHEYIGATYDLYYHEKDIGSVIVRFGNDNSDFVTGINIIKNIKGPKYKLHPIREALRRIADIKVTENITVRKFYESRLNSILKHKIIYK
jgi:hypothetical protein